MGFKICLVGCGNMTFGNHGPALKKYAALQPEVELAACCDRDQDRAVSCRQEFGFSRHYTDLDTMLDTEKPQAVCMIVPVNLTAGLSCKILEKGYPLIMEKPPGMNRLETLQMIGAAKTGNTPNQVAFNRRYMPIVRKLKELLDNERENGGILDIQYRMLREGRKETDFSTTAIHGIDVVKFLACSDYKSVDFHYQEMKAAGVGVANFRLDCRFESGTTARLDFFPVSGADIERIEVNTYNGIYYLNIPLWNGAIDMPGRLLHIVGNKTVQDTDGYSISGCRDGYVLGGFYTENEMFLDDLRNGRKPAGDIESGLQSVEIAESIRNRENKYMGEK